MAGKSRKLTLNREEDAITLIDVFRRRSLESVMYAYVMSEVRPFAIIKPGGAPFDDDKQVFTAEYREKLFFNFFIKNSELVGGSFCSYFAPSILTGSLKSGRHILKPFVVDPELEDAVNPDTNIICVPFLKDKDATRIATGSNTGKETYLFRPGIELIIRDRLLNSSTDVKFLDYADKVLKNQVAPGEEADNLDQTTLRLSVAALAADNNIKNTSIDELFPAGVTQTQISRISGIVKLIIVVTKRLKQAVQEIDEAREEIDWIALPNKNGPELGAKGAQLYKTNTTMSSSIDQTIAELDIKRQYAQSQFLTLTGLGKFASPFQLNAGQKDVHILTKALQELIEFRDGIATKAFKAMRDIEYISGEVSGIGLIDILSIYLALWSLDEKSLLGFLDDAAFTRLLDKSNSDLITDEVSKRKNGETQAIDVTLQNFEERLVNILSFAEKAFSEQYLSPHERTLGVV